MTIQPVHLVIEPSRYVSELPISPHQKSARESYQCDRFAEELRRYTEAPVTLIEDFLSHVPLDGFVLLYASADLATVFNECSEQLRETLTHRLIPVAIDRTEVWQELAQHKLPVAIDYHQYFLWNREVKGIIGYTLNGLHSVAINMNSDVLRKKGNYCVLGSKEAETLPSFLVRYLEEYTRMSSSV